MCQQALPTCMLLIALRFLHLQSPKLTKADVLLAVPRALALLWWSFGQIPSSTSHFGLSFPPSFFFHLTAMAHPSHNFFALPWEHSTSKHSCDSWHCTKARAVGIREQIVQCICSWSDMANPRTICWRCLFDFKLVVRMSLGLVSNMEALLYTVLWYWKWTPTSHHFSMKVAASALNHLDFQSGALTHFFCWWHVDYNRFCMVFVQFSPWRLRMGLVKPSTRRDRLIRRCPS